MPFEQERMPTPDKYGYFYHPDIPGDDEGDDVLALLQNLGYRALVVEFEYDATDKLHDDYYEREDQTAAGRWVPTTPDGDGWQLVAKYDTEDGPCALFVSPNAKVRGDAPLYGAASLSTDGLGVAVPPAPTFED